MKNERQELIDKYTKISNHEQFLKDQARMNQSFQPEHRTEALEIVKILEDLRNQLAQKIFELDDNS